MMLGTSTESPFTPRWARWIALLLLCSAYLQGAIDKLLDVAGASAEMQHFGLAPAGAFVGVTIVFELVASAMVLSGVLRWLGALALAGFTIVAAFVANRFWDAVPPDRLMLANAFFEHWGLAGAFLLVAWHDLKARHDHSI